jgi:mannose-6-phosphate isomerase-like protein (cupin superfamily)
MNQLPRTVTHPLVGDKVTFIKTAHDTNNEYCLVEVELLPNGGNDLHYHTSFVERFEAVEGILGVQVGKQDIFLKAGETYEVQKRVVHRFYNPDPLKTIRFMVTITPAMYFEELIRIAYGLANDGKVNKHGIPKSIWHTAILFHIGDSFLPVVPYFLQRGIFGMLARRAFKKRKDKDLVKYIGDQSDRLKYK